MSRTYSDQEQRNKAIVLDFYQKALGDWDYAAASVHLGDYYVQHSPTVADGLAGLKAFIENVPPEVRGHLKVDIRRVLVDGDIVALHTMNSLPGTPGRVIVDIFRLEDGKIVEHWDVLQWVPTESLHNNLMA